MNTPNLIHDFESNYPIIVIHRKDHPRRVDISPLVQCARYVWRSSPDCDLLSWPKLRCSSKDDESTRQEAVTSMFRALAVSYSVYRSWSARVPSERHSNIHKRAKMRTPIAKTAVKTH